MKSHLVFWVSICLAAAFLFSAALTAEASPQPQAVIYTPTPRPDGRIIYIVKLGDTCISVSLLMRIDLDQLRNLNNLKGSDCVITVGQELLLGMAGPAESPTPGPSPTSTPQLPTSTPLPGNGSVCVVMYADVNGDGIKDDIELTLAGGAVSLTDRTGKISRTGTTVVIPDPTVDKPLCFDGIPEGDYNVSLAVPQGYNATTNTNYPLKVIAGTTSTLDFGAQPSLVAAPTAVPGDTGRSPLLGIFGGVLLLAGAGLAIYLRRTSK